LARRGRKSLAKAAIQHLAQQAGEVAQRRGRHHDDSRRTARAAFARATRREFIRPRRVLRRGLRLKSGVGLRLKSGLVAFGRASACADGGGWGYHRLGASIGALRLVPASLQTGIILKVGSTGLD
jgi:hypothetical protein